MKRRWVLLVCMVLVLSSCSRGPTAEDAKAFVERAESQLLELSHEAGRAQWVQATYITEDTEALAAAANEKLLSATAALAKQAARYDKTPGLAPDVARKLHLLKTGLTLAPPSNPEESKEVARLAARMEAVYGKGKYCPPGVTDESKCMDVNRITEIMATSRDPKLLAEVWAGWHTISPPIRKDYQRFVELSNKGARELGFADTGAMWRARYDMPPDEFARELDRLWEQVRPLYLSLHAYVRSKLREKYGPEVVPDEGPIPAHLLGNIWSQSWENVFPLVAPKNADPGYDLTELLKARKLTPIEMVRYGERFFTSLGLAPLPETFWRRSLFVKPADRDVVCHASAWNVDNDEDLRIKMCIQINAEDFVTIHHELGHNFYQRAYNKQPFLFREGANDGFHEAIGDTIALSVTPEYLVQLGFLKHAPPESKDIGLLLSRALEKVAFLPFGLVIDQWRWKVFSGETPPEKYNQSWWELRTKYQGIVPPVARSEKDFDPGAKYHVPANVPYMRYFLAHILQFQLHKALAEAAGCNGPLHRCSIYGNRQAGEKLQRLLAAGASKPWPDVLEEITGKRQLDASPMLEYFEPLRRWLDEQNRGKKAGW